MIKDIKGAQTSKEVRINDVDDGEGEEEEDSRRQQVATQELLQQQQHDDELEYEKSGLELMSYDNTAAAVAAAADDELSELDAQPVEEAGAEDAAAEEKFQYQQELQQQQQLDEREQQQQQREEELEQLEQERQQQQQLAQLFQLAQSSQQHEQMLHAAAVAAATATATATATRIGSPPGGRQQLGQLQHTHAQPHTHSQHHRYHIHAASHQEQQQQQLQHTEQQQLLLSRASLVQQQQQHQHQQQRRTMEWSNNDALALIEQYRQHTELWDRSDPKYKDKVGRFRAWTEIAAHFACSKAEVERKMNVLLTQYRREKHKMLVKLYQGMDANPSKWYAFKQFEFMEPNGGLLSGIEGSTTTTAAAAAGTTAGSGSGATTSNGLNGYAMAAAAAAAAAAVTSNPMAVGSSTSSGGGTPHRRSRHRDMKYFNCAATSPMVMPYWAGESRPTAVAATFNAPSQYSPPINEQVRLHLPTMQYSATQATDAAAAAAAAGALFRTQTVGGGGGSSGAGSDYNNSPQKALADMVETELYKEEPEPDRSQTPKTSSSTPHEALEANAVATAAAGGGSNLPITRQSQFSFQQQLQTGEDYDIKFELTDRLSGSGGQSTSSVLIDGSGYAHELRTIGRSGALKRSRQNTTSPMPAHQIKRQLNASSPLLTNPLLEPINMHKPSTSTAIGANIIAAGRISQMPVNPSLPSADQDQKQELAAGGQRHSPSPGERHECDTFIAMVAARLYRMDRTQRYIAEHLIGRVLYHGQLEELQRTAEVRPR